jgi:AraC family transcriptional regulator, regulatory protein of adaptative response / methylated-DNA-[protein]-cysteine methyltransferase
LVFARVRRHCEFDRKIRGDFAKRRGQNTFPLIQIPGMKQTLSTAHNAQTEHNYRTEQERWSALIDRDRRADGLFVYSVRTTGIYCRPACPSRLASRENIRFHASCEAAERAGFRACKRCRPNEAPLERHASAVAEACRLIDNAHELPSLQALATRVGMSAFHFHRIFKKATGLTPKAYATASRAQRVRTKLLQTRTITDALYDAGFNSNARFYANSRETLGMNAKSFRNRGKGERIRFGTARCALGWVLVAATEKGICSTTLGDEPESLVQELELRFSNAALVSDRSLSGLVRKVVAYIETPQVPLDLPLDLRGTLFQKRVWRALRDIPAGTTLTYKQLAQRLDAPTSARAVARACASNPIAVMIPCHRIVARDGALAGYRWGLERKRKLLERESQARPKPKTRSTGSRKTKTSTVHTTS